MFSPLEQFENHVFYPLALQAFDVSISSFALSLIFSLAFFCLLFGFATARLYLVPTPFQLALESFYSAVVGMVRSQTGLAGMPFFPYVFTLFTFIFCSNLLGLIPFSFTPTAQIFLPFALAFASNLALLIKGIEDHEAGFLRLFIPSGISPALVPLIFTIELSTYLLRSFSLALRLFANMMAGHTLLFICSMTLSLGFASGNYPVFFTGYLLVMGVFLLELLISFLQAYVFSVLFCVYLNDALHPGHLRIEAQINFLGVAGASLR